MEESENIGQEVVTAADELTDRNTLGLDSTPDALQQLMERARDVGDPEATSDLEQDDALEVLRRDYASSYLCKKCDNLFRSWPRLMEEIYQVPVEPIRISSTSYSSQSGLITVPHWETPQLLEMAALKGCHLCAQIHCKLVVGHPEWSSALSESKKREALGSSHDERDRRDIALQWMEDLDKFSEDPNAVPETERMASRFISDLHMNSSWWTTTRTCFSNMQVAEIEQERVRNITTSTGDQDWLQQAKTWLQTCQNSHGCCNAFFQKAEFPTRLVAINGTSPRLVLSTELSGAPEYATLSHCWGGLETMTLKTANLNELQEYIPWDQLCETFQNACLVTEELGFKYIWIDSLCIIQDCEKDWERESVSMSKVYGHSSLNIAASSACDGNEGLFPKQGRFKRHSQTIIQTLKVRLPQHSLTLVPGNETGSTTSRMIKVPGAEINNEKWYEIVDIELYEEIIRKPPLARRAWALQERILSPRTLLFSTQLGFVCRERQRGERDGFRCETFPDGVPSWYTVFSTTFYEDEQDVEHWNMVVKEYTRCNLTFESDRLVAISGIAEKLQERYKDEYFAGLWKRGLPSQLLWYGISATVAPKSPGRLKYTPPSWSWANHHGPVLCHDSFHHEPSEKIFRVLDVQTVLCGSSPFGNVLSGQLTLRSPYLLPFIYVLGEIPLDIPSPLKSIKVFPKLSRAEERGKITAKLSFDEHRSDAEEDLFLLGGSIGKPYLTSSEHSMLAGLVIQPTGPAQSKQGEYKRVGFFEINSQSNNQKRWDDFMAFLDKEVMAVEENNYIGTPELDEKGRKTYAVTIV